MKKILVESWESTSPDGKETIKESTLNVVNVLMNVIMAKEELSGFDNFTFISKVSAALEDAKETGELLLDDVEHEKLVELSKKHVPAQWGSNPDIVRAYDAFLHA